MPPVTQVLSRADLLPNAPTAYRRVEIAHALRRLCLESERYWHGMTAEEFAARIGGAWSPADNVRHLTKAVRPVVMAMRLPRFVLRMRFGSSSAVSRSYEQIASAYRDALQKGGTAGRYAPAPETWTEASEYRSRVLADHRRAVHGLATEVTAWEHRHIDALCLPHPLLGRLTVREMLLWTLCHNMHHVLVVARRRGEYFTDETPLNS
jgi:hypothetical protein